MASKSVIIGRLIRQRRRADVLIPLWCGNREHAEDAQELDDWFEHSGSTWCCVMPPANKTFGHIHYDMLPDKIGTTDKHGFLRTNEFQVNLGP